LAYQLDVLPPSEFSEEPEVCKPKKPIKKKKKGSKKLSENNLNNTVDGNRHTD
jgi:hypothetical protein